MSDPFYPSYGFQN